MLERTSTTERYTRGFAAAVVAVATLILAANAGPARAAEPAQEQHRAQQAHVSTLRGGPAVVEMPVR
ncbi:hypothetical protein OHT76_22685 [Streptomyces sp. NBC_00287]|uniref:hypothetical protein n=1 Tax=Streptomyces sp. NBC_00287 TaxID=2975702 RepID=UPI002E2DAF86|nr:hypothetical protein [Streptomyces sp. NBC_00287]